jgi:hypothetical protein
MTPERDVDHTPQRSLAGEFAPPPREPEARAAPFREINERRARVENSELLRHLRGL